VNCPRCGAALPMLFDGDFQLFGGCRGCRRPAEDPAVALGSPEPQEKASRKPGPPFYSRIGTAFAGRPVAFATMEAYFPTC
jgi:hypothetical protein